MLKNMEINKNKTGLALGAFLGIWHLLWTVLVAIGLAQPLLNFIYRVHFLNNPFQVSPFGIKRAVALVVITAVVGYIAGWAIAFLWNRFHRQTV